MMIRSNDRYFDFKGDVEMEKQSKLFESLDETTGDFSYQFEMDRTANNMSMLGFPLADSIKSIYRSVPADILDEDNIPMYAGQIRVERLNKTSISCSFFSGNYNWMGLLGGEISEIDFSDLDTDLSETEIINAGVNTEGIFFPLIDTGGLITRGGANLVVQDFTGMIFLKTAFDRIFSNVGVKIQGDLLRDPVYNSALISRLTVDQNSVDDRSTYANKTSDHNFFVGGLGPDPALVKITFQDDSTFPFFDGPNDNYDSTISTYTPDVDMDLDIDVSIKCAYYNGGLGNAGDVFEFKIYVDSIEVYKVRSAPPPPPPTVTTISFKRNIKVDAGSLVEVYVYVDPVTILIPPDNIITYIYTDSTIRFTPTFIYRVFGNSLLPNWTKAQLVNSVLSLFCCICDYDHSSKTLTIDFFKGIKSKEPIDISGFITIREQDTAEFISDFAKKTLLKYEDSEFDAIKEYNVRYSEPYAAGVINVDNDFIPATTTILDNDFKAPVSYINPVFAASLERVNFVEMEEKDSTEFTSIQNSSGSARINMADAGIFSRLQICRIENCTVPEYNGDWLITTVSTTFIVIDRAFSTTATGTVTRLSHQYTNTEDVHIFLAATYDDFNVPRFSNNELYRLVENSYANISYAFFNILNTGVQINEDYKQGLAIGVVNNKLSYQKTLLDTYWADVDNVLNDPVKLFADGLLPKATFLSMTPLRPLRVRTVETDGLYYQNRITGYKKSYVPCSIELIKLS